MNPATAETATAVNEGAPVDATPPADRAPRSRSGAVTAGPALVLMSLGLMLVAQAAVGSRDDGPGTVDRVLYVAGLLLVFVPAAAGVLLPRVAGSTRVLLAVAMMLLLQVARLVVEPSGFGEPIALLQRNALSMIEQSGGLSIDNPLAPLLAFYPGLLVATDAIGQLTGLGPHASGVVVLLAARLVTALAVLLLVAWVTRSTRIGAAAVVLYALDPRLPVVGGGFDSPTLALALAGLTVYLVLSRRRGSPLGVVPGVLAVWALVATDHLVAVGVVVALVVWAGLEVALRRGKDSSAVAAGVVAVAGVVGLAVSLRVAGNPAGVLSDGAGGLDLGSVTLVDHADVLRGTAWAWLLVMASLALTLLALGVALWRTRSLARDRSSLGVLLLALAVAFPLLLLAGLLSPGLREGIDSATAVVYLGVAGVVAAWVWWTPARDAKAAVVTAGAAVVFVGSLLLGTGGLDAQLPGPYRAGDGARSLDPDNVAAAQWMSTGLPSGSVVYGDRAAVLLAGTVGGQVVLGDPGPEASRLLLDPEVGAADTRVVREAGIDFLVVDRRDAEELPAQGFYADPDELDDADRTAPVSAQALAKFDTVAGVDMVYDNGAIVIYDLRGLDVG